MTATTVISTNYPPQIDVSKVPLAFGSRAIPKLNRELASDVLLERQRALMALCDLLKNPEHVANALHQGVLHNLRLLLKDPDNTVRHKSVESLYIIAAHAIGRIAWVDVHIVKRVSKLFDDSVQIVRLYAHLGIERVSQQPAGAIEIVKKKILPSLIEKLSIEQEEIQLVILDTLHYCGIIYPVAILKSTETTMTTFAALLHHENPTIRAKAARDIWDICVPIIGKTEALTLGITEKLLDMLLHDENKDVVAMVIGAITSICITTTGKFWARDEMNNLLPRLLGLVNDPETELRINTIKCLTVLSEAPQIRTALRKDGLEQIEKVTNEAVPDETEVLKQSQALLVRAAQICVKSILWEP